MTSQYEYAKDHLKQVVKAEEDEGEYSSEFTGKKFMIDLVCGAVIIGAWAGGYYYFEPMKNAEGING
jgi:hypothetical protein